MMMMIMNLWMYSGEKTVSVKILHKKKKRTSRFT
jgi:hypothetical protein